jgi:transcriptional regulator with PAS, ATPase and Fis domain
VKLAFPMSESVNTYDFLGMTAIVASARMRALMAMVERIARSQTSVLILGESGTGKEVIARALHQLSLRCNRPWVDVSCAALPEHLMESELFGYERGAFSGADSLKPGLFELAHLGTLFLDEVGELPAKMQVKLLRVLDGVPYYRLGGTKKVCVDVRVLAATNQNLEHGVKEGWFRNDLYHRLSQVTVEVPPLREREADIAALAVHFLRLQGDDLRLTDEAMAAMSRYSWPGNVRELRNRVMRAALLAEQGIVQSFDLGLPENALAGTESILAGVNAAIVNETSLDGLEKQTILRVLNDSGGHRQRAAELLGISRRTLSRKLKQYRLEGHCGGPETAAEAYETPARTYLHG